MEVWASTYSASELGALTANKDNCQTYAGQRGGVGVGRAHTFQGCTWLDRRGVEEEEGWSEGWAGMSEDMGLEGELI